MRPLFGLRETEEVTGGCRNWKGFYFALFNKYHCEDQTVWTKVGRACRIWVDGEGC